MSNRKDYFSFIKKNKKKVACLAALMVCAGAFAATGKFTSDKAANEDIPIHDGDVLVDSLNVKDEESGEKGDAKDSELVTSDDVSELENKDTYFQELRATLDMDRNQIISMLTEAESSASTKAEKEEATAEKMRLLNYMEQEKTIETLIKNKHKVPSEIFTLCKNLSQKDLDKAPKLEEIKDDFLEFIKDTDLTLNIEIKNNKVRYKNIEKDILDIVKQYEMEDKVVISSFNYKSLKRISKLNSKVKTAYLVGPLTFKRRNLKKILKICKDCKCTYIHPSCDVVNKEFVAEAHKRGLLVQVYTVNSVTIMKKLIKLKVDGVFTNYPKIINTLVNG